MVIGFLIFWVLIGLGVFFVAMRGGPRGARESLHTEAKLGQHAVTLGVVVLFAFCLAVPALVAAEGPRTVRPLLRGLSHARRHQGGRADRPEPRRAGRR